MPESAIDNLQYSIQATASRAEDVTLVLKHGEIFAIFDHYGDIHPTGLGEQGIYYEGTRFLSKLQFLLYNERPTLLNSTVKEDNALITVDLTNPALYHNEKVAVPSGTLHIFRGTLLWNGTCCSHIRFTNYGLNPLAVSFRLRFDADYKDIFEVRGLKRKQHGQRLADVIEDDTITLAYEGLDGVIRRTHINCSPKPTDIEQGQLNYEFSLQPREAANFFITVTCLVEDATPARPLEFHEVWSRINQSLELYQHRSCQVTTSHAPFNEWFGRSYIDLFMMTTDTDYGAYPFAGVPWFSTVFGRDGIITALESLWLNPSMAKGVLNFLAAHQAHSINREQDAEPGKILHELRKGEMANLKEVPFGCYYGSVDSTPLFIMLAAAYYEWTGDQAFIEAIWPNIEAALEWIDVYGDEDGDGFVEYLRHSPEGLVQQGWKDSGDSVFHADGELASGPIALCEVQGYVYAALMGARQIAADLGYPERARELVRKAKNLKRRFEEAFWLEDLKIYALALDGHKRPCRVRASNAGHCLLTGIADPTRAWLTAQTLLGETMFSGWGIRTLATTEARYNPMSYHNGSIWPHDNALIASGFARYHFRDEVMKVLNAFYDLSQEVELHRLPELFCGFHRRPGEGPILYPVACSPQSWATATVFSLLQACLNLEVRGKYSRVSLYRPTLPSFLNEVHIKNLRVGQGLVDLVFYRYDQDIGFGVTRKEGDIEVMVVK